MPLAYRIENGPTMEVTRDDGAFRVRLVAAMPVSNGRVRDLRFDRDRQRHLDHNGEPAAG